MSLASRQVVEMLRAAGEPTRFRILALLAREELAVAELTRVLDQSQPRVSRHLKLLIAAGLVERFPDGAWVFYRLATHGAQRAFIDEMLALIDEADGGDAGIARDAACLEAVRAERSKAAADYFAQNAARWDHLRSLYVSEADVEAAILAAVGPGPFHRLIDLGTGAGRMLSLLGPLAQSALGLDLSQQMLNIARRATADAGLGHCELRHGDVFATQLPTGCADLVVVHQVLHYLADPAAAVAEAARLVAPGGRLVIVDFAPHGLEFLREAHQHRRLGLADAEMDRWLTTAGLGAVEPVSLPPVGDAGLTVKIWTAPRQTAGQRSAA
ncbi:MAG TPA: metalloregulator ArsR/SmtB family transcription factor [Caulobacteraceae bacterium]|jgi:ArsR family transcriptional regulator|nr:metalloregulator ArsR/SmtB family transcription factor [Caulobacteraceae bacterium]